jgi:phosphoglycerate dehydrogenase-like enzyme
MDSLSYAPRIAVLPRGQREWLDNAVRAGGGIVSAVSDAAGIVWTDPRDAGGLQELLKENPMVRWVQLPFAGVENFLGVIDPVRVWTCGKGVYAEPVAEMALALALAGMRGLGSYARTTRWSGPIGRNLLGARVTILGGGGIAQSLIRLLSPWNCEITVVRKTPMPMAGCSQVLGVQDLAVALTGAELVVCALSLTPETVGILGAREFGLMADDAWLVNVGRGAHVVTDDLVEALRNGVIGGAGLDVTDPEPLPESHPLWDLPNCIITPHVANTPEMAVPLLADRVRHNVARYAAGLPLIGLVDVEAGY